jgi:D-threo-aldose 1-dehydrogenase
MLQSLVLGIAPAAGLYERGIEQQQVTELVKAFVAASGGDRCIDTAPWYGTGRSEIDLGVAVAALDDADRARVCIWTKVGRVIVDSSAVAKDDDRVEFSRHAFAPNALTDAGMVCAHDYTHAGVMASWAQSQARLGAAAAARVVGLRLHDVDTPQRFHDAFIGTRGDGSDTGFAALLQLQRDGIIKHVGLGINDATFAIRCAEEAARHGHPLHSVLLAGSWNLVDATAAAALISCHAAGTQMWNAGIFASGFLCGGNCVRYEPAAPDMLAWRQSVLDVCAVCIQKTRAGDAISPQGLLKAVALLSAHRAAAAPEVTPTRCVVGCATASEWEEIRQMVVALDVGGGAPLFDAASEAWRIIVADGLTELRP